MIKRPFNITIPSLSLLALCALPFAGLNAAQQSADHNTEDFLQSYCLECHNLDDWAGTLDMELLDLENIPVDAEVWEKVISKLEGAYMPPAGQPRPDQAGYDGMIAHLESELDSHGASNPDPGRPGLYRLNRTEYASVIRDLLDYRLEIEDILPPDNSSYGFDNIADIMSMSSTLLEGYLAAADRVSAIVVGDPDFAPEEAHYPVSNALSQDEYLEGLPLGTRGGTQVEHHFPLDALYEINSRFVGNSVDAIRGLQFPHQYEVAIDGKRVKLVTIGGNADYNLMMENSAASKLEIEARTQVLIPVTAGTHKVTLTFIEKTGALALDQLQPYERENFDPVALGGMPSLFHVTIRGPFNGEAPSQTTASRAAIFSCTPERLSREGRCAQEILSGLARQAYRRPVNDADIDTLMEFFRLGREAKGTFDGGIQMGVRRILMSPDFLFRLEKDPEDAMPDEIFTLSGLELASRLSFFLWSSVPDDELIQLASRNRLGDPDILENQVTRMLADERSRALVDNFAGQWLHLRNLDSVNPDGLVYPNFDENLRQAFLLETSQFFNSIMAEDRPVTELLTANYTFVNERLARHYGIDGIKGDDFQRVEHSDPNRYGILGHGSIHTVTSFPHRTSPVVRGKWVMENILGAEVPAPPDDVPALEENAADAIDKLSMRERLANHRDNPACNSCHSMLDPIGFAMERFDGIGRYRELDEGGLPIDSSGILSDGTPIDGPQGLRQAIVDKPEIFIKTFTSKMLTYALGRGLEHYDGPTVRQIVREAGKADYRFSAVVQEIVKSVPFQMKRAGDSETNGIEIAKAD
ncbi:MAG: DUF1592 domain-containing protein [Gammaproteobacteria bacterium]|nr:DUF1592 domain-containing protein [Gammaproteobacteria bacterium]